MSFKIDNLYNKCHWAPHDFRICREEATAANQMMDPFINWPGYYDPEDGQNSHPDRIYNEEGAQGYIKLGTINVFLLLSVYTL